MSCTIKIKTIKEFQEQGAIKNTREVLDLALFDKLNSEITSLYYNKYGIGNGKQKFFDTENRYVSLANGRQRFLVRAIPNETLFNALEDVLPQNIIQKTPEVLTLTSLPKPNIQLDFVGDEVLLDFDNALELKRKQDKLKKDYQDLQNLINCVWAS